MLGSFQLKPTHVQIKPDPLYLKQSSVALHLQMFDAVRITSSGVTVL